MNSASTPFRLARAWLPVIFWMAVIFMASTDTMAAGRTSRFLEPTLRWLVPAISRAELDFAQLVIRKAAHMTEYAILAAFLCSALWQTGGFSIGKRKIILIVLTVSALYAAGDEFHQSFVQSRTASPYDVLFDIAGATFGTALFFSLQKRFTRRITE